MISADLRAESRRIAERSAGVVLVPDSRGSTWDAIRGDFGPDVAFLDSALTLVFRQVPIDATRIAIGGFSDGASYALGLGMANGDLFSRIVAFSPGFAPPAERVGRPRILITHGTADRILPIARTSRPLVPQLRRRGYDVTYTEFAGGHTLAESIVDQAAEWLAAR
jgi:predicted esterase